MSNVFWIAVLSSFSSWDDIIVCVKLLVYYVLFAEDNKTGFLSVGVGIFKSVIFEGTTNFLAHGANDWYKTNIW